jgi:hypothetical protein
MPRLIDSWHKNQEPILYERICEVAHVSDLRSNTEVFERNIFSENDHSIPSVCLTI